jgi:hypothetical protein
VLANLVWQTAKLSNEDPPSGPAGREYQGVLPIPPDVERRCECFRPGAPIAHPSLRETKH